MNTRVLHVVPNLVPDGLERMVANLATGTNRRHFQVFVASLYSEQPGSLAAALESEGVRVFHLGKRRGLDLRMFGRIDKLLAELRPDIVHTHNYVLRYTLPPTLRRGTPVRVHTIHNVADREVDRLGVWTQRLAFRGWVVPVVIAEAAAASFERVYRLSRPPLIMNGIEVARYRAGNGARDQWRQREGFCADDVLFICAARFFPQKNHRALLQAFAAGPARLPHCRLVLAGDGYLGPELEQQARNLGISGRVRFLGRREDIPDVLRGCDVFALASLWEGNPLAVMEAMAAGLPSVVTAAGGVPELVASGVHGMVVAPGDVAAMADAMLRLAEAPELRKAMGDAAAEHARSKFDVRRMVEAYESLYEQLRTSAVPGRANACTAN